MMTLHAICRTGNRLFLPNVDNLADVHIVDAEAVALVPLALLSGHKVRVELLAVDFLALDGEVRFRVDGVAQFREFDGEAGAGHLVLVPSGDPAQIGQPVPHRFGEVRDREVVVLFHELVRVAAGGHVDDEHGLVPEFADGAPGNRHQVHVPFLPGRYFQPVPVDHLDRIPVDLGRGDLLPGLVLEILAVLGGVYAT